MIVIGAQWGDEGKGKIIDALSYTYNFEWIIRYGGGANAGHSIVKDGVRYVFHLLPSGILHDNVKVLLGPAMVIDPEQLQLELKNLEIHNVNWKNRVFISDRAHLVFPSYKKEDAKIEKKRGKKLGTTRKGIGTAYARKMLRSGMRVADIDDATQLSLLKRQDKLFLNEYRDFLKSLAINHYVILEGTSENSQILFEGAQGVMLDLDYGTYPYVTSGPTAINGVMMTGFSPKKIQKIVGVSKVYSTRVGEGPMPSEFTPENEELLKLIQERGHEKGSTTGRMRRCGFLDLVGLKYAHSVTGINSLALTHLDVLDVLEKIHVCVGYERENTFYEYLPSNASLLYQLKPVLKSLDGWLSDSTAVRQWDDLPANALELIRFIESYLGIPVEIVSVGPDRAQTIYKASFAPFGKTYL